MSRHWTGSVSTLFILIAAITGISATAPIRYKDDVFASVTTLADIHYSEPLAYSGSKEKLFLNLYEPQGDTAQARPLFIWVHGGGFSAGTKDDSDVVSLCRFFARKGYVTASIGYRLEPASRLDNAEAMDVAIYRAVQDARAAVRFLRAHKPIYNIDDTRILMGGTSAGGVISLLYAYLDQSEVPPSVDVSAHGTLDGSGVALGTSSAINGIVNCWGGVGDSTWLNNGKLPVLSFHGTEDLTVPYDKGYSLGNPALVTFGSACVHRVLTRRGVHSILKPFAGMGHGIPDGDARSDTLVNMTRDFAWDLLFGDASTSLKGGKPPGPRARVATPTESRSIQADGKILKPGSRRPSLRLFH